MSVQITIESDPSKFVPTTNRLDAAQTAAGPCIAAPTSSTPDDAVGVTCNPTDAAEPDDDDTLGLEVAASRDGVTLTFARNDMLRGPQTGRPAFGLRMTYDEFQSFVSVIMGLWSCYNPEADPEDLCDE